MSPEQKELEYVKLWMEQSKLFWSRLQSVALLHSGVLAGWYSLGANHPNLRAGLLCVGFIISGFILAIMWRDGQYMNSLRTKAGYSFPWTGKDAPYGRACGYIIVGILMGVEFILFFKPCIKLALGAK